MTPPYVLNGKLVMLLSNVELLHEDVEKLLALQDYSEKEQYLKALLKQKSPPS